VKTEKAVSDRAARWAMRLLNNPSETRKSLRSLLDRLDTLCVQATRPKTDGLSSSEALNAAMKCLTGWPYKEDFDRLAQAVARLYYVERRTAPRPLWNAYEIVDKRHPGPTHPLETQ
jgi:hypothetical protein